MAQHIIFSQSDTGRRESAAAKLLGHNWVQRFIKRHCNLQSIIAKPLEQSQHNACTPDNLEAWFEVYRTMVNTYHPETHNIYNVDETGFRIGATAKCYGIIDKEQGSTGYFGEGLRGEALTVIECGCADGTVILPFIIFKGENLQST